MYTISQFIGKQNIFYTNFNMNHSDYNKAINYELRHGKLEYITGERDTNTKMFSRKISFVMSLCNGASMIR